MSEADLSARRVRRSTTIGLLVGGAVYVATLLDWSTNLLRTASAPGYFANRYDTPARALMAGHLAVPKGSLSIEGIVYDGHTYMYFPPFPALLRIPVFLVTHEYDGKLSLLSMVLAWGVFAAMTARLAWLVLRIVTGRDTVSRFESVAVGVFLVAATGGTVLTYDASLPWVYHEAYLWAVAVALGALYWMVRCLHEPTTSSLRWLALFALLCVLTRATEGWAVCVVLIGLGAWSVVGRGPEHLRRWGWALLGAGLAPLLVGIGISEIKFDSVYLHPLQDQVWTSLNARRREALRVNGGSLTGPQFFTTSFMAYFRFDGIRFVDYFPWITLPAHPAPAYDGAFVDQSYRTGSVTAFMPLLLVLTVVSACRVFLGRWRPEHRALRLPLLAAVLITGGVMGYGYYAYRYVSDFVPALVLGGAIGFALLARAVERRPRLVRGGLVVAAAATVFSLAANTAAGFATAAMTTEGGPLARYVRAQLAVTPSATRAKVVRVESLPASGRTDDIAVLGDCDAVYLESGDSYRPWSTVAMRDQHVSVTATASPTSGTYEVFRLAARPDPFTASLEVQPGRARVVLAHDGDEERGSWQRFTAGDTVTVDVSPVVDFEVYRILTTPGGQVGYLADNWHDKAWYYYDVVPETTDEAIATAASSGLRLVTFKGAAPRICTDLLR